MAIDNEETFDMLHTGLGVAGSATKAILPLSLVFHGTDYFLYSLEHDLVGAAIKTGKAGASKLLNKEVKKFLNKEVDKIFS